MAMSAEHRSELKPFTGKLRSPYEWKIILEWDEPPSPLKNNNKNITFFKRENQSTQRYKKGEVYIRRFDINTVYFFHAVHIHTESAIKKKINISNFILVRVYREFEAIINDCNDWQVYFIKKRWSPMGLNHWLAEKILFRYLSKVYTKSFSIRVYNIIEDISKFNSIY